MKPLWNFVSVHGYPESLDQIVQVLTRAGSEKHEHYRYNRYNDGWEYLANEGWCQSTLGIMAWRPVPESIPESTYVPMLDENFSTLDVVCALESIQETALSALNAVRKSASESDLELPHLRKGEDMVLVPRRLLVALKEIIG